MVALEPERGIQEWRPRSTQRQRHGSERGKGRGANQDQPTELGHIGETLVRDFRTGTQRPDNRLTFSPGQLDRRRAGVRHCLSGMFASTSPVYTSPPVRAACESFAAANVAVELYSHQEGLHVPENRRRRRG